MEVAGWAGIGVGVAVALIGGILWSNSAPVHYEGRAVQWTPEQGVLDHTSPGAHDPAP
jgi:hypothetical protein